MTEPETPNYFGNDATDRLPVDRNELRAEVQDKYAAVALEPDGEFHFHTGRPNAEHCRYDMQQVDSLPDATVESFAGVANPFELAPIEQGERVIDLGAGAGFDSLLAAAATGPAGQVVGFDMTTPMIDKARAAAHAAGADNVEVRPGYIEDLPIADGWADVVISNGVINLCPDKDAVLAEIRRVLRPGGRLQFADIANGAPVPEQARRTIDLWTG
ncbi:MAG: methyltransferase domain-containing protein [Actinomycetota bacterium]